MRASLFASWFALCALPLGAEVVHFAVAEQTAFGQSIYVTAEHPLMGADAIVRSVKLSPHAYPVWQASFDLPAGATVTPKYYRRPDAPASAGDAGSAVLVQTGATVVVPGDAGTDWPVHWYADAGVASAVVRVTSAAAGFVPVDVPMGFVDLPGGLRRFDATVPAEHRAMGRRYQIVAPGKTLPADGAAAIVDGPVWWRHDQAFLYDAIDVAQTPTATRRENFAFAPTAFAGRTIRVLLPRDYDRNPGRRYPVLYAQDGQNVFTPGGPFGTWNMDGICSNLIRRGEIPEIVVVGIDNTSDRISEYSPEYSTLANPRGGEFLARLRDELLPEIDARYRTATGPERTAHIGSSLGGTLGYHAAADYADTWGTVAAMSTAFWSALDGSTARAERGPANFARTWIDSGTAGASSDDYWNTFGVRDAMIESGHAFGENFGHALGIGQQHNEAAWQARLPDVLRWMYGPMAGELARTEASGGDVWMLR